MKVVDPGHHYILQWLDATEPPGPFAHDDLIFVKRTGEGYPGNDDAHPGTTMQEVLRALIDRVKYVNAQVPHARNEYVLQHLRAAIYQLEMRAAERHDRRLTYGIDELNRIEELPTCSKCLHLGCNGTCRASSTGHHDGSTHD